MASIGAAAVIQLDSVTVTAKTITDQRTRQALRINAARTALLRQDATLLELVVLTDEGSRKRAEDEITASDTAYDRAWAMYKDHTTERVGTISATEGAMGMYRAVRDETMLPASRAHDAQAFQNGRLTQSPARDVVVSNLDELAQVESDGVAAGGRDIQRARTEAVREVLVILVAGLLVGGAAALLLASTIVRSVRQMEAALQAIAEGDLTAVAPAASRDEIGRMMAAYERARRQASHLEELAQRDGLTGLANRRAWDAELPAAIARARRDNSVFSVAIIDLDRFKRFNDTYGHPAGDRLLEQAAGLWVSELRRGDLLARYGGEEFAVLLPGVGETEAIRLLDRLRVATPQGETCSAGVAVWDGSECGEELVARADAALYVAKRAGRNQVVAAQDRMPAAGTDSVPGAA